MPRPQEPMDPSMPPEPPPEGGCVCPACGAKLRLDTAEEEDAEPPALTNLKGKMSAMQDQGGEYA